MLVVRSLLAVQRVIMQVCPLVCAPACARARACGCACVRVRACMRACECYPQLRAVDVVLVNGQWSMDPPMRAVVLAMWVITLVCGCARVITLVCGCARVHPCVRHQPGPRPLLRG